MTNRSAASWRWIAGGVVAALVVAMVVIGGRRLAEYRRSRASRYA